MIYWPKILAGIATLVVFIPLIAIYAYRSFNDTEKRLPKAAKGANYFIIGTLIMLGVFGSFSVDAFAIFIIVAIFMLGSMEIAYHIDVLLDIKDELRNKLIRN